MDQNVEWLGVGVNNRIKSNCMVELSVCVLTMWLSEGCVKGDTWSWPIEVQESEVSALIPRNPLN